MKKIKILGKTYTIKYCQEHDSNLIVDNHVCNGKVDLDKLIIYISKELNKEVKEEVILHEAIHALSNALDLDMTETQTVRLAEGLLAVLKDNKLLKQS